MRHLLVPLAVVALAAGCTPDVAPTSSPSVFVSPTVSASSSVSPSPSPTAVESFPPAPASESAEQAAIRAAWMEYWRIHHKFTSDPTLSDLSETQYITTGDQQNVILDVIAQLRDQKLRTLGGLQFRSVAVDGPLSGETGGVRFATVSYCVDRRELRVENYETGESMAAPGAPTFLEKAVMNEGSDGQWRVAMMTNEAAPC